MPAHTRERCENLEVTDVQTMELRLNKSDGRSVRVEVSGKISRDGWTGSGNPLENIYGDEIFSRTVLMNLAKSMYIDSTGVEWLLSCHRKFEENGGVLIMHSPNPMTMQLLKMMRMDLVLNVVEDEAAARKLAETKAAENQHNEQTQEPDSQNHHQPQHGRG